MAWLLGTSIPPSLQTLWNALTSPGKNSQGPNGSLRIKKGKKKPKKPPKANKDIVAFRSIAEIVYTLRGGSLGNPEADLFIFTLVREMAVGVVNPKYFRPCQVKSAQTLESIPSNTPDLTPPVYAYRDPAFMPSDVVYPDGSISSGVATYQGAKVGGFFHDTVLRWRKLLFSTYWIDEADAAQRLLLLWDTTISITSSTRGSRPMVSLNIAGFVAKPGALSLAGTTPPIKKKTTLYWRFKAPPSSAPFYNTYQVRRITRPFARVSKKQGSGVGGSIVINASNRPMMGRGFNNNEQVTTSFNADPQLYEIKPPCVPWSFGQGNSWVWKETPTDIWTVTIYTQNCIITTARLLLFNIGLSVTNGVTTHTFVVSQSMPGNWSWFFDYSGGDGDGALPAATSVQVADASCGGNQAILAVRRTGLHFLKGQRGFLLLTLTSPSSATIATIADTPRCNEVSMTTEKHNYPTAGLQTDTTYTQPQTIWAWFNESDQVEEVQLSEFTFINAETAAGFSEARLSIAGVNLSVIRTDYDGTSIYTSSIDGYNDGGRVKLFLFGFRYLDKSKTLSMVDPTWNTRLLSTSLEGYYTGTAQAANEINHPTAAASIQPLITSNKKVQFNIDVYHYISQGGQNLTPLGSPPAFVLSDRYFGNTISPGTVDTTIVHTVI